ncbi:MAG: hypothetical protein WBX25_03445 [Rhodomicrobium sp.]
MHSTKRIAIGALASLGLIGYAAAAELTGAEIKDLISGKTAYVETTAASITGAIGNGVIYYGADGNGLYKTPKGELWHGTWKIEGNTLCTVWKEGPKRPCLKFDKEGSEVKVIDVQTGQTRVKIVKTAPGNAEKLAP